DYVESAANGSPLGDAVEVAALTTAFQEEAGDMARAAPCAVGSIKSNIGHLEAASGVSQLSKVVLQLAHGELVPSSNAQPRNSRLRLEKDTFAIQEALRPWPEASDPVTGQRQPRRALISSYGAGGSYGNAVVEEYVTEACEPPGDGQIGRSPVFCF